MPRINVRRVLSNPQFSDDFIIYRKKGKFVAGRFVESDKITINAIGVVQPAGTKDIIQVPEADRTSEIMTILYKDKLYVTHVATDETSGTSDEILYQGTRYRLYQVKNWSANGYYRAIGISI